MFLDLKNEVWSHFKWNFVLSFDTLQLRYLVYTWKKRHLVYTCNFEVQVSIDVECSERTQHESWYIGGFCPLPLPLPPSPLCNEKTEILTEEIS